ncbi:hypothetical protein [Streptococcus halichoeri]|uniref:hypothetical protein n=1 Tax=Streptococcus halichoeri TaxID=254785 RepID=UPI00135BAE73|nr:hypothetical protein [Streptococcus halichoeri]
MTVFKNVSRIFGANALQRNGRLGDYTNVRDFTLGNIYVSNDNLVQYFDGGPFEAILVTVDGLKSFSTTKYRAYIDAAEYGKTDNNVADMSSFVGIYVDGYKIFSVWSNGHQLYQIRTPPGLSDMTLTVWGRPQLYEDSNSMYFYLRVEDTPQTLVDNLDFVTAVYLDSVSLGDRIALTVQKTEGFYLFSVRNTNKKVNLHDNMSVKFSFGGDK